MRTILCMLALTVVYVLAGAPHKHKTNEVHHG